MSGPAKAAVAERAQLPVAEFPEVQRLADQLMEIPAWRNPYNGLD